MGDEFKRTGLCHYCRRHGHTRSLQYCQRCWAAIRHTNKIGVCYRCAPRVLAIRDAPYLDEAEVEPFYALLPRFKAASVTTPTPEEDPQREQRIAYYAQRAELDLPLFDDTPYCGPLFRRKEIA